jgi:hypothetical protein
MVIFQIVGNVFFKICQASGEGRVDFVGFCEWVIIYCFGLQQAGVGCVININ